MIPVGEQSAEVMGVEVAVATEFKYPVGICIHTDSPQKKVVIPTTPWARCFRYQFPYDDVNQ